MTFFLFHARLLHNLIRIVSFQVWVNAPLNLEAFSDYLSSDTSYTSYLLVKLGGSRNCGNHVLVSGENRRNPPGNHKRRGYCCFWSILKVICHFKFWGKKNGNQLEGGGRGHYENSRNISRKTLSFSKALSNYIELDFKNEGLSNFIGDT